MNILIITPDYPDRYKVHYPFVKQLVDEYARQGHKCFVIAPYSITKNKHFYKPKENDGEVMVYRPNHLSLSNLKIGGVRLSDFFRRRAINRATKWLPVKPDVVYCHFWKSVIEAYPYAKSENIPMFVATGESSILDIKTSGVVTSEMREYVRGVICVSSKNKEESVAMGLTTPDKCIVKPNSVNSTLFKKLNKTECREKLGIPEDVFVVSFVGAFINRKGENRVTEAISKTKGRTVCSMFIGKGDEDPTCDNILFKGRLLHEQIPIYLNASDCFVLPTLAEGCCNAVVEAMACGLPIISSNRPFNWDVLDDSNSIMVNPNDVDAIAKAIERVRDDWELRNQMAEASLLKARALTIDQRAKSIIEFMKSRMVD